MERARHMAFLIKIIETYGFRDMIELERDNDGDLLPVMYPFGYQFAKSNAIRFKSEEQAQEALWTLRGNGRIYYDYPESEECRIRLKSGYTSRTLEEQTAEFELRKLRCSMKYHEVPDETYRTDWRQCKTWFLPEGKCSKKDMRCQVEQRGMETGVSQSHH